MADRNGYRPKNTELERLILIVLGGLALKKAWDSLAKGWPPEPRPKARPPSPPVCMPL